MKKFVPEPLDVEEFRRNPPPWPPAQYIADVMAELLSRQRGYPVQFILTPKSKDEPGG